MLPPELFDLRASLQRQGIIFAYSGYMTETVLSGVGEALKQKLTIDDAATKTLRSVFAVFVEQMQNIIRYSAELEEKQGRAESQILEIRYGILTIGQENGDYVVHAGNLVARSDVERVSSAPRSHSAYASASTPASLRSVISAAASAWTIRSSATP